jgi:hypothetical protein
MMRKEMPRKYWRNLPEAQLIAPLAAQAQERSGAMIEQPATVPLRRIPSPCRTIPPCRCTPTASIPGGAEGAHAALPRVPDRRVRDAGGGRRRAALCRR